MDKLDQEIINELISGGFRKSADLANTFNVVERTIRRRLNNLLDKRMIRIIAVPNPVALGFSAWSKIGIKVSPGALNKVTQVLINQPAIYFVAYAFGRFDVFIGVHFVNLEELIYFVNSELPGIEGILYAETWVLVSPRKYYHFLWPASDFQKADIFSKRHCNAPANRNRYLLDEVDQKILDLLREDGLTNPQQIKNALGIKEATIRKHIKNMQANDVYKLEVVPNPEILELEAWATIGITINHEFVDKLIDSITKYPDVYLASGSLGRFNIIISARFRNTNLLTHFVTKELPSITGISSIETYLHNKPLKYHNVTFPHLLD